MNAQHLMKSAEWFTPTMIVEAVHSLFQDEYMLDPSSCAHANKVVKAHRYFSISDDGLSAAWRHFDTDSVSHPVSVFLNPPGGKVGNVSLPKLFWQKLRQEIADGNVDHAVYLAYSIEQLQQLQSDGIQACTVCLPPRRIRYLQPQEDGSLKPMSSPTHSSAIVYVPGNVDRRYKFITLFRNIGSIYAPC